MLMIPTKAFGLFPLRKKLRPSLMQFSHNPSIHPILNREREVILHPVYFGVHNSSKSLMTSLASSQE
jgi:hypothetical protein